MHKALRDKNQSFYKSDKFLRVLEICVLSMITISGFILRFHKVGKDSFWLDEALQGLAAIQPTFMGTLVVARQYPGGMPLDFLVSHMMASISMDETVMRFPSVVWGTLLIIIYFFLVRELDFPRKNPASFLVSLLLALSPIFIQYSQEMRVYASYSFFYAASTLLLIRAIKNSSNSDWFFYILVTAVGVYFQPFVFFTMLTGLVLILGKYIPNMNIKSQFSTDKENLLKFVISSMILIALIIPGYWFISGGPSLSFDLGLTLVRVLEGLGLEAYIIEHGLGQIGLWHVMLMIGTLGGLIVVIVGFRKYNLVVSLLIAFFLQFILIVGLDIYKHYFFSVRQIIHLAPMLLILTAIFIVECITMVHVPPIRYILWFLFVGIIIISPVEYIKAIYDHSKGNGGVIAQVIISEYQPGQKVLAFSSEYLIMDYYFKRFGNSDQLMPIIVEANDVNELENMLETDNQIVYVVIPQDAPVNVRTGVLHFGFKNHFGKPLPDSLFERSQ